MAKSKKTRKKKEDKTKKKSYRWLYVFGFVAFLIGLYFVSGSIFDNYREVEYDGLVFTRQNLEGFKFFYYSYFFEDNGQIFKYNLYLRNNPAENDVPIVGEGPIRYDEGKITYVSVNSTNLGTCEEGTIATAALAGFLIANKVKVKVATPDLAESKEKDIRFVTCKSRPDMHNTAIIFQEGKETKVTIDNDNKCYLIEVADCEATLAVEKFIVQSIIDGLDPDYNVPSELE